jgi:NADH:ubiquinone oxidoreductase subunit F (NADH-binding)
MVQTLGNLSEFYAHESCGQCTPCREGALWLSKATHRLSHGEGRKADAAIDLYPRVEDGLRSIAAIHAAVASAGKAGAWVDARPKMFR